MKSTRIIKIGLPGLLLWLSLVVFVSPAAAVPVTLDISGSVFTVNDPSDVFGTVIGSTYSLLLTYDPDLLPGTDTGGSTLYETAPGESSISFSMTTSGGDSFTSDNSLPIRIFVSNTPDFLETMNFMDGDDRFRVDGNTNEMATLRLVLVEAQGSNPLSSENLPTDGFGSGPGTWTVAELDIDRTDLFAEFTAGVTQIEKVAVPEPSTGLLYFMGGLVFWMSRRFRNGAGMA